LPMRRFTKSSPRLVGLENCAGGSVDVEAADEMKRAIDKRGSIVLKSCI